MRCSSEEISSATQPPLDMFGPGGVAPNVRFPQQQSVAAAAIAAANRQQAMVEQLQQQQQQQQQQQRLISSLLSSGLQVNAAQLQVTNSLHTCTPVVYCLQVYKSMPHSYR